MLALGRMVKFVASPPETSKNNTCAFERDGMKINSAGAASHINMGVVSRPMSGFGESSDHDNGVRAHGNPDSFRSDFRSLVRAVRSGDMTSAQSALETIKTDVASHTATYSPASTTTSTDSPFSTDLKALFDAVGSGDATSAQSALAQFVSDRRDAWQAQSTSTSSVSSPSVHGHQGRRFYDLESVIASLFGSSETSSPATDPSATDTSSAPTTPAETPVDSTSAPADVTA